MGTCSGGLTSALGAGHVRARLQVEQQPALLGAALDVRDGILALAVAAIVGERVRACGMVVQRPLIDLLRPARSKLTS